MKAFYFMPIICLSLIFSPVNGSCQFFSVPDIKGEEKFSYIIQPKEKEQFINRKWGINVYNAVMHISNRMEETPQGKKLTMIMSGKDEKTGGEMVVLNVFSAAAEGLKQTLFDKKIIFSKTGEVLFHYQVKLDKMSGIFPPNTYTSEVFPLCMRGLDFKNKQKLKFYWWGSERSVMPLYTKIKPPVEMNVKAGKFLCYRVETWADLTDFARIGNFLLKLVSPFLPVYCNYFTVEPPYHFIAFTGPAGPPGSPEVFTELLKMEPSAEK